MDHADHVRLLRDGVPHEAGTWADLGAGSGAFTLALADLLPPGSLIYAVDKDASALRELAESYRKRDPRIETRHADFTRALDLPRLDGIVMANSLHFVKDKEPVLARVWALLKPAAPLLIVEYDTNGGNMWVPYPFSFETWRSLAVATHFAEPRLLATHPSRFLRRIYSASTTRPAT
jgi:trans-aconitate methyltransferase